MIPHILKSLFTLLSQKWPKIGLKNLKTFCQCSKIKNILIAPLWNFEWKAIFEALPLVHIVKRCISFYSLIISPERLNEFWTIYYGNMGYQIHQEGYKIRIFFANNQQNFIGKYCISWIEVVGRWQNVVKSDFQSHFFLSKIVSCFYNFLLDNMNLGAHFWLSTLFDHFNFWSTIFFLIWRLIFDGLPLCQYQKYITFLSVLSFGLESSNFVSLLWKLNNPYYNTIHTFFTLMNGLNPLWKKEKCTSWAPPSGKLLWDIISWTGCQNNTIDVSLGKFDIKFWKKDNMIKVSPTPVPKRVNP